MTPFCLPRLLVVTDGSRVRGLPLQDVVRAVVGGGARAVLLREKHLPRERRAQLACEIRAVLAPLGGVLLVASDTSLPADGVHLAASDPFPGGATGFVGRSCHSARDVSRAAEEGCHYATLSPIFTTSSKPGYGPALGLGALADLALPTWALGGVTARNAASCLGAGARGVAVMGAIMGAPDPRVATAGIGRALCEPPP